LSIWIIIGIVVGIIVLLAIVITIIIFATRSDESTNLNENIPLNEYSIR
jgi:uncharacterized protein YneF (UPF0154 family)